MRAFRSIRSRIVAFAVLATLVPALGLGYITYRHDQARIAENLGIELRTLAHAARSELARWRSLHAEDVRALASAETIVDGLDTLDRLSARSAGSDGQSDAAPAARMRMAVYLRSVQGTLETVRGLTVFDAQGAIVASTAPTPRRFAVPGTWPKDLEADGPGGALVWATDADATDRPPTLAVVVPIRSLEDRIAGAFAAEFDIEELRSRLNRVTQASEAALILLSAQGRPLLSTAEPSDALAPLAPGDLERLRARPGVPVEFRGHRDERVIGMLANAGIPGFALVAERDSTDVFAERERLLQVFVGLTAALTLAVALIAFWIGRSIVRPLGGFVDAVDRIAAGDLDTRMHASRLSELSRLAAAMNVMVERLAASREEIESSRRALERQNTLLEALSITDGLTGLYNRKKLDAVLTEQLALFRRYRRPFVLLMLDLDHFKALNDTHGHLAGDRVLASVAAVLRRCVRNVDHAARYGGEEFAVVLVDASLAAALETAERIRTAVAEASIEVEGEPLAVTVSVGVTESCAGDDRPEDMVARADRALYEAKHAGRDRVCHEACGASPAAMAT